MFWYVFGLILFVIGADILNLWAYFMGTGSITTDMVWLPVGLVVFVWGMMVLAYAWTRAPKAKPLGERGSAAAPVALVFGLVGWAIILLLIGCYMVNHGIMLPRGW